MNKAIISGFAALAVLTALPAQAGNHCGGGNNCDTCKVNLLIKPNELKVTPANAKCVLPNSSFTIDVKPPGAGVGRTITVRSKEGVPLGIEGDNGDNPDEVEVRISEGGSSGINYGYIIEVSDHGILDPEVRVVSSRMLMLNVEIEQANAVLEEAMGFGVDELIDKQAEYKELAKRAK